MNIHRLDNTNVGDWWSPPGRYFPFKPSPVLDIINSNQIPNNKEIYIIGGGGLGRPFFREHLERLKRKDRQYKLIAWGVGSDIEENKEGIIFKDLINGKDLLGDYFDGFDEVGTRVYDPKKLILGFLALPQCTHHFLITGISSLIKKLGFICIKEYH